jgi:non-ribosomal peptide synthetase component E (peptide arylation enzyme)
VSGAPGYPSTVGRVLTRSATRLSGKLALTFADRRWTYAELDRAACARSTPSDTSSELRDQLSAPAVPQPS